MSLQFVFGPSGGGKSHYLYETIIEEAKKDRTRDFLLIVPEQFTMKTQKELVERSEHHAIMNIDVLSFERLVFRVFDELGMYQIRVLEETGKNLILRKLAQDQGDRMKVLGTNLKKMGYVSEMKSLISEFMQYQITPKEVAEWIEDEEFSQAFRLKMEDVLLIYQEFVDYLGEGYITSEEVLEECARVAERSVMLQNCNLIFDGFTGFTPVQVKLLETLIPMTDRIWAAVTLDAAQDPFREVGMQELFYMSHKMVKALMQLSQTAGCEVLEPVWVQDGKDYRFASALALRHLEENLFRHHAKTYEEKQSEISIRSLLNQREELTFAAAQIHRMVREEHYRYRDFAIVSGDAAGYANYVREIFEAYGIPYFVDEKKTILFHPFIEFLRASLEMLEEDFSYESVMRYFRTGLSSLTRTEIDRLENYILAANIRGRKKWGSAFIKCPRGYEEEDLEELNRIREAFWENASYLWESMKNQKNTVRQKTEGFYEFILRHRIEEQLHEKKEAFEAEGDYATAKQYEQIYGIVMDLLDKITGLLGEEMLSVEEYGDILDAGFEAAKVGVIPPGYDCVVLGDIERTRLDDIKVLFFVGVNDGIIPKSGSGGGVLSNLEREVLLEKEIQLAPTPRERTFIQKFYLYMNLTKPQHRLILTFSRVDSQGKAIRPSYLISQIRKLYPGIAIEEDYERELVLATPRSSLPYFLEGLGNSTERQKETWLTLAHWYLKNGEWSAPVRGLIEAAFTTYHARRLPKGLIHELYGRVLESSVTRLERFAACACAHYLQFGLGLEERLIQEFTPADFGNVFHAAIEDFSKELRREGLTWNDLDEESMKRLEETSFLSSLEKNKVEQVFDTKKSEFLIRQMRRVYHRTIQTLTEQVRKGQFRPEGYEVAFSAANHLDAVQFVLSDEEKMHLRGRIDRLDTYAANGKVYVKIIDYKTGNTNFQLVNLYHGLQLQLVVYLNAALEVTKQKHPKQEVLPAGIFYYHVDDPYIEGRAGMSPEEIGEAMLEQLKLDGIVSDEEEVYRAMDADMGSASHIIPVKLKKDGSLSAVSKTLSDTAFSNIGDYVQQMIQNLGEDMMGGNVAAEPYLQEKKSGCDYCSYRSVCGFDEKIPGYGYRRLEKSMKDEEVLQKISERLKKGGD